MDRETLEKLKRQAMSDDVPPEQVMEMARHVDCVAMAAHHENIQTRWRVRLLVAGVIDVAAQMEGVEAAVLDFTNSGTGWSLAKSMQVKVAPGHDEAKIAKKFDRATGAIRSRLGFSREVYQSIALHFSYSRVEIDPLHPDAWLELAASGDRINAQSIAWAHQQAMEKSTPTTTAQGRAQPRM